VGVAFVATIMGGIKHMADEGDPDEEPVAGTQDRLFTRDLSPVVLAIFSICNLAAGSIIMGKTLLYTDVYSPTGPLEAVNIAALFIWLPLLFLSWLTGIVALYLVRLPRLALAFTALYGLVAFASFIPTLNPTIELPPRDFAAELVVALFWMLNAASLFNIIVVFKHSIIGSAARD